jgi:hypothetical protein
MLIEDAQGGTWGEMVFLCGKKVFNVEKVGEYIIQLINEKEVQWFFNRESIL